MAEHEFAPMTAPTPECGDACPTTCDPDCSVACHEVHQVETKRNHDVRACIQRQCAPERGDVSSEPTAEGLTDAEDAALAEWWVSEGGDHEDLAIEGLTDVVERILADHLAPVQAERDEAREKAAWWERTCAYWNEQAIEAQRFRDMNATRAESAEAERDAARAALDRVKALAEQWAADDQESLNRFGQHLMGGSVLSCAEHLRAAVEGGRP